MKTIYILLICTCSFLLNPEIFAQFSLETNTVDSSEIKSLIKKINDLNQKIGSNNEVSRNNQNNNEILTKNIIDNYVLNSEIMRLEEEINLLGKADGSNLEAIGNLTANLNNLTVAPAIVLSGNYQTGKLRFDLRLQAASQSKDSSTNSNIFVNDKSLYALSFNTTYTPNPMFGLNLLFTYCGKNVTGIDTTANIKKNEDFGVLNLKFGVEFIPVPRKLSVYAFGNLNSAVTNVNNYESIVGSDKKRTNIYMEVGVKGLVQLPGITNENNLVLGFSMILVNEDMRNILSNKDRIIPSISIGYMGNITGSNGK